MTTKPVEIRIDHVPLWIGGEKAAGSGNFEVRDPGRTVDIVATVASADVSHVDRAVAAAEAGYKEWAALSLEERIGILSDAADVLEPLAPILAPTLARENGGVLREARMDLERSIGVLRSSLDMAREYLRPQIIETDTHWLRIEKKPVGTVGLIVPWNSPMVLSMNKVAPALVAGNSVILKPASDAPVVLSYMMTELARMLPRGVVNVLNSSGSIGSSLSAHPKIRKVSFTGSTEVGKAVMRSAADNLKKISLELGGNDPAIILEDADFDSIMGALCQGIFTRAGQICFAVKRVYVPRARYNEFFMKMRAVVDGYRVGHGLSDGTTFGPLINERQLNSVRALVERTRDAGATIHELGSKVDDSTFEDGYYMLPVVVTDIEHGAELVGCEQFGPVIPIVAYDTVAEAIAMANDSEFGLASSVWGTDLGVAIEVARQLEAGSTFINSHNVWSLSFDMPFGGVKQSGIGRERTELGLQEYVEDHAIRLIKS
jgi:acyl-CoA reductase-like NAD-dependent aldehyde dehydrogenase